MTKTDILNQVIAIFPESEFDIVHNERLLSDSWKKPTIDIVVYKKSKEGLEPFAVIVSTSSGVSGVNITYAKQIVKRVVIDSVFWLGIVINDEGDINVYSPTGGSQLFSWKKKDFVEFEKNVREYQATRFDKVKFLEEANIILSSLKTESKREKIIVETLRDELPRLEFNVYGRTVSASLDGQFKIVVNLLKAFDVKSSKQFCRYTSAGSLHRIISNKKESMCGLAVMNDRSEGFFLDKCISPTTSTNIWTRPQREIDTYNEAFITSLCDCRKTDNLTMWRLYGGNDGDGVCLEYDIDKKLLRNCDNFLLMPVLYGKTNNPLIQLFRLLGKVPFISGFQFVFSYKNILRYFVKPEEFAIEEEHRLLFIRNAAPGNDACEPKWIFNADYNIFHPIQELECKPSKKKIYSPLILKKIILGPKCKESKVNRVQLRTWLNQIGLKNIIIEESSIDFYR